MKDNNVIIQLLQAARKNPYKTAIQYYSGEERGPLYRSVTFKTLLQDVMAEAAFLKSKGLGRGDRIVVFIPMSYALYRVVLAIFYMGATAVFIDAWADRKRLNQACRLIQPRGFIGIGKAHLLRIYSEIRKIPIKIVSATGTPGDGLPDLEGFSPEILSEEADALVTFTTGSTGTPKAARRTHGFLMRQHQVLSKNLLLKPDDVDLTTLPMFVLNNLASGVTSVLPRFNPAHPADFDPAEVLCQIRICGITTSGGSPAFYEVLADHILACGASCPLRSLFTGGAPVFPPLARKFLQAFPDTEITIVYGATEAEPISEINAREVAAADIGRGLPVGKRVSDIRVNILSIPADSQEEETGRPLSRRLARKSEVGEIIVCGPHVLREYLGDTGDTARNKITDGQNLWHRTGDAGWVDERGVIRLLGRVQNRFVRDDLCVYTLPLEQMLRDIEGVVFTAVFEVRSEVYALIEPAPGFSRRGRSSLLDQARSLLSTYPVDHFLIRDSIPRDPRHHSKVNYEALKRQYSAKGF